jgi:hypothetical protein
MIPRDRMFDSRSTFMTPNIYTIPGLADAEKGRGTHFEPHLLSNNRMIGRSEVKQTPI